MPHFRFTRPLSEFYLADELRNKPCSGGSRTSLLVEGLLVGAQRLHRFIERLERRLVKADADMPSVTPTFIRLAAYRQHQRAKVLARSARLSVTDDYDLLLVHSLELEPLACSLTRVVEPRRTLGDHAGQQERVVPVLRKWLVPGLDCAASLRHFGGRIRARIRSNKSR